MREYRMASMPEAYAPSLVKLVAYAPSPLKIEAYAPSLIGIRFEKGHTLREWRLNLLHMCAVLILIRFAWSTLVSGARVRV
jgi:hypothetical protein